MEVIYHIGLPKTGTTFLQTDYFTHLRGNYLAPPKGPPMDPAVREWISFVRGQTRTVSPWQSGVSDPNVVIYSAEEISVTWLRRPSLGKPYPDWTPSSVSDVAARLACFHVAKFKGARAHVLVGFREMETFLPSYFAQVGYRHLPHGAQTFNDLLDFVEVSPERFDPRAIREALACHFDDIFMYKQEELFENCKLLNQWVSKFGLDGSHIQTQRRNVRATEENKIWRQRRLPRPGVLAPIARLLPDSVTRKARKMILSGGVDRFLAKDFRPTEAELIRLKKINEIFR